MQTLTHQTHQSIMAKSSGHLPALVYSSSANQYGAPMDTPMSYPCMYLPRTIVPVEAYSLPWPDCPPCGNIDPSRSSNVSGPLLNNRTQIRSAHKPHIFPVDLEPPGQTCR